MSSRRKPKPPKKSPQTLAQGQKRLREHRRKKGEQNEMKQQYQKAYPRSNMSGPITEFESRTGLPEDVIYLSLMQDMLPLEKKTGIDFQITHKDFLDSDGGLIMFYNPSSVRSMRFWPVFQQVAKMLKGHCPVGAVNCEDKLKGNKILADYLGVKGYPTIKFYNKGSFTDYSGGKNLTEMLSFICTALGICNTFSDFSK